MTPTYSYGDPYIDWLAATKDPESNWRMLSERSGYSVAAQARFWCHVRYEWRLLNAETCAKCPGRGAGEWCTGGGR
jgi:hypothetical protein